MKRSSKWSDAIVRTISGFAITGFQLFLLLCGQKLICFELLILQVVVFFEFTSAFDHNENPKVQEKLPRKSIFQSVFPYLLLALANYYFHIQRFADVIHCQYSLKKYHSLICFTLLGLFLQFFVFTVPFNSLKPTFSKFGLVIIATFIFSGTFYLFLNVVDFSIYWVFTSFTVVGMNDTFAYFVGKAFGKTKLIELSPNKTFEGFLGGFFGSVVVGFFLPFVFHKWTFFVTRNPLPFDLFGHYPLPTEFEKQTFEIFGNSLSIYPAQFLTSVMALFASLIAPAGGFIASGFKRSVGIKDFSNIIPGHGGILDRIDCQIVSGLFCYFLLTAFLE